MNIVKRIFWFLFRRKKKSQLSALTAQELQDLCRSSVEKMTEDTIKKLIISGGAK